MDEHTRQRDPSNGTTGDQTRDLSQLPPPTTPSTPPTFGAPENTDAAPSEFESAAWLLAQRPGSTLRGAIRRPLHREHAHVVKTPYIDVVTFHPDDPKSLATGEPEFHPAGTEYFVAKTDCGPDEDGRTLESVSMATGPHYVRVSEAGVPGHSLVDVGTEIVLRPVFETPPDQSQNRSRQPLLRSDIVSRFAELLNESLGRHGVEDGGESRE